MDVYFGPEIGMHFARRALCPWRAVHSTRAPEKVCFGSPIRNYVTYFGPGPGENS
jgi:hypothetical protein